MKVVKISHISATFVDVDAHLQHPSRSTWDPTRESDPILAVSVAKLLHRQVRGIRTRKFTLTSLRMCAASVELVSSGRACWGAISFLNILMIGRSRAPTGKQFKLPAMLRCHVRQVHSDEYAYLCPDCPAQFKLQGGLKKHRRAVHDQSKPHRCSVCDRLFSQAANLRTHMRVHTGERPFQCPVCGLTFSHSGTVKSHMRCHADKLPLMSPAPAVFVEW